MFLIPSQQIPDLFDPKVVNEDFEIICKRASSVLGVSTQKLMDALQQSAEDELQHRFQKAIQKARSSQESKPTKKTEDSHKTKHPCCVEACIVKKITKPQYIDGKLYCSAHYKQIKNKGDSPLTSSTLSDESSLFTPGSTEGTDQIELQPKPISDETHRSYWSCVPISYTDKHGNEVHYKLHKPSGIILDKIVKHDGTIGFALMGHYEQDQFTDKLDVNSTLLNWCKESGILV